MGVAVRGSRPASASAFLIWFRFRFCSSTSVACIWSSNFSDVVAHREGSSHQRWSDSCPSNLRVPVLASSCEVSTLAIYLLQAHLPVAAAFGIE